jgi:GNAT superfamily N-acetyltransferase
VTGLPAMPEGFTTRRLTFEDAAAVADLVGDCEEFEDGEREIEAADIRAFWSIPDVDLDVYSIGVFRDDRLAAAGDVRKAYAEIDVHPDFRGRGIGSAILPWTWAMARAQGEDHVRQTFTDARADGRALFLANGYEARWTSWMLRTALADVVEEPLPVGYAIRDLDYARDAREVFDVIDTAFDEFRDRPGDGWEPWDGFIGSHAALAPWASAVVEHEGRIVGASIAFDYGTQLPGWIQQLAVAAPQRGIGLGGALLRRSFARFRAAGHTEASLATDSRTGALTLYEHVGMHVRTSSTHWVKELPPA